jgi:DNA-binding response OmpR family regulator
MEKKKIVVIHEEALILQWIAQMLRPEYTMLSSMNATEGLVMAKHAGADLVILDTLMPSLNSAGIQREFRELSKDVPIIALLPDGSLHFVEVALDTGASDYVTFPFDDLDLKEHIKFAFVDDLTV